MFVNSYKFVISKIANKTTVVLLLIILTGAFLRLYDFGNLLRFNNDQVRDAQIVDAMHSGENFPLFGPKAGGTKFNLGGAFYYLEYLSGFIFGFSPAGIAFFIPLLSIISIYLFFLLFKKIFTVNIALGLTFLYAISFYAIKYSHFAWNPNAIPFFILAFLFLLTRLLDNKSKCRDFIFLGVIIGITTQLHTALLILMPLTTLVVIIYAYFKKIKITFLNILLLIFLFVLVNLPFIYGNILDEGKNIQEFFAGTSAKTSSQLSPIKNITATINFFLQGSSYYLTGIEPQKNWFNVIKLIKSKNITELLLFMTSALIFLAGVYTLFIKKTQSAQKFITHNSVFPQVIFTFLAFIFFILIGNELNIRFFIIISFLPYLFLGLISTYLNDIIKSKRVKVIIFSAFIIFLTVLNLNMFIQTYNLNNYQAPESAYGGISYGELNNLCLSIKNALLKHPEGIQEASVESFSFKRSLEYICLKNHNLKINYFSENSTPADEILFVIAENKNANKNIETYQKNNNSINSTQIKRFTLLKIQFNQ